MRETLAVNQPHIMTVHKKTLLFAAIRLIHTDEELFRTFDSAKSAGGARRIDARVALKAFAILPKNNNQSIKCRYKLGKVSIGMVTVWADCGGTGFMRATHCARHNGASRSALVRRFYLTLKFEAYYKSTTGQYL